MKEVIDGQEYHKKLQCKNSDAKNNNKMIKFFERGI
jgi:hypothetical protein